MHEWHEPPRASTKVAAAGATSRETGHFAWIAVMPGLSRFTLVIQTCECLVNNPEVREDGRTFAFIIALEFLYAVSACSRSLMAEQCACLFEKRIYAGNAGSCLLLI
jgi:hypothetical protein